jgi:transposase
MRSRLPPSPAGAGAATGPARLLADKAYGDDHLAKQGVVLLAPHRRNRVRPPRHDGRTAQRLKGRYVVERTLAWLHDFRRRPIRHERQAFIAAGFVALACLIIVARQL